MLAHVGGVLGAHAEQHRFIGGADVGGASGQRLVEDGTHREQIAPLVQIGLALGLFRSHVGCGAQHRPALRVGVRIQPVAPDLRDPKIDQLDPGQWLVVGAQEHVLGLQIAMHDPCRVGAHQGV